MVVVLIYILTNSMSGSFSLQILASVFFIFDLSDESNPYWSEVISHYSILISLVTNDVDIVYILVRYSFDKCLFSSLAHLKNWIICFPLLTFFSSLHILDMNARISAHSLVVSSLW